MNIKIREAALKDQDAILSVLNEVALHLQSKGIQQWEYPWNEQEIRKEIEKRHLYVLTLDEKVIATFGMKVIDALADLQIKIGSKYLYQIAISPEYQGQGIGAQITAFARRLASPTIYLDCWAGNKKLINFYKRMNFQHLGDFPEEDYFISVFQYSKNEEE